MLPPAEHLRRTRLAPQVAGYYRRPLARRALETEAARVQVFPGIEVRSVAVCAACRGRASICACCTCNTLASAGAISLTEHSAVTQGVRLCDGRHLPRPLPDASLFCFSTV